VAQMQAIEVADGADRTAQALRHGTYPRPQGRRPSAESGDRMRLFGARSHDVKGPRKRSVG
jgi:hypothetical protein